MLEKIIEMLSVDEYLTADENIQIAKGKYSYPKTLEDILVLIKRELKKK
jgi:hypothetical protein